MKKKLLLSLLCTLLLLAGVSCQHKKNQSDYSDYLKIGYLPSTDALPYIVALRQGIYDSLGVKVRLVPMESEEQRDTLFQQTETDGLILSPIEAFLLQKQGYTAIPTLTNEGLYYLVASCDSTFTRPEQLTERCLSVARYTASEFFADKVLERLGIDEDHINKPSLSTETLRLRMLVNEQIDAAVLQAPSLPEAIQEGGKVWMNSTAFPVTLSVTAFSDSILQSKKEEIERLVTGYNLAVQYMNEHPQEVWLPQAAAAAGLPSALSELPSFSETAAPSRPAMEEIIQWMQKKELLPTPYIGYRVEYTLAGKPHLIRHRPDSTQTPQP